MFKLSHRSFPSARLIWVCGLLFVAALATGHTLTRRSHAAAKQLTFEDRIAAQRAIEEVYWRHRIWPKENPQPKPALDEVMPEQVIRSKVEDYQGNRAIRSRN